jgi:hypothetical protein
MARNTADDIDTEIYSLDKFIALFTEGQTVAVDMMFATPILEAGRDYSPVWAELWKNRARMMSKQTAAFLGYCRKQCAKYGAKGSRVAAARDTASLLAQLTEAHGTQSKLGDHAAIIEAFAAATEHAEVLDVELTTQGKVIRHLSVCQKKAPFTVTLKEAHAIYKRLFDEYGERARQAEANEGIDWKALSHAVRVGTQSVEFLTEGFVTFPRPDAAHLLKIKRGDLPYAVVAAEIEALLAEVEEAAARSPLPEKPDLEWCDDFITSVYGEEVRRAS